MQAEARRRRAEHAILAELARSYDVRTSTISRLTTEGNKRISSIEKYLISRERVMRELLLVRVLVLVAALFTVAGLASRSDASAAALETLYDFCSKRGCADGVQPRAGVIMDPSGKLYGTTSVGIAFHNRGAVFELMPDAVKKQWTAELLHKFCPGIVNSCRDGSHPVAKLVMVAGNLYGTTSEGGIYNQGTVFELTPNAAKTQWTERVLHDFCSQISCIDGNDPEAALIMDESGTLYGTTYRGGAHGEGTVFELAPNVTKTTWTYKILYSFGASFFDGISPAAGLIKDRSGNLFGTTFSGGAYAFYGTVFELRPNASKTQWTEQVLYNFGSQGDGRNPVAALIIDADGHLYGTTSEGGTHRGSSVGGGTVFELIPNATKTAWEEKILYNFCSRQDCTDGNDPEAGLLMDSSGMFYGTTHYGGAHEFGAVFDLTPNAAKTKWTYKILYSFCQGGGYCVDGGDPYADLIMDGSGNLYGTTSYGGAVSGGTVFELKR
jgi:uncharacterized repeat protein (TIGR03803 family)